MWFVEQVVPCSCVEKFNNFVVDSFFKNNIFCPHLTNEDDSLRLWLQCHLKSL